MKRSTARVAASRLTMSFANPAATFARSLTGSFAGIRPVDVPAFVAAEIAGGAAAAVVFRWLLAGPAPLEDGR